MGRRHRGAARQEYAGQDDSIFDGQDLDQEDHDEEERCAAIVGQDHEQIREQDGVEEEKEEDGEPVVTTDWKMS